MEGMKFIRNICNGIFLKEEHYTMQAGRYNCYYCSSIGHLRLLLALHPCDGQHGLVNRWQLE